MIKFISTAEIAVLVFTLLYVAVWLVVCLIVGNSEFIFYFVVMCFLVTVVGITHLRMRFHIGALWGLSLWGLAHMAGGLLPIPGSWPAAGHSHVLYNWWLVPGWLKFDQVVHAYGFGLITWICWQILQRIFARHGVEAKPGFALLTLCVAGGMGYGAANEVVEFIASITLRETNVGGYENTGWDLVANFVGSLLVAILLWLYGRAKKN